MVIKLVWLRNGRNVHKENSTEIQWKAQYWSDLKLKKRYRSVLDSASKILGTLFLIYPDLAEVVSE